MSKKLIWWLAFSLAIGCWNVNVAEALGVLQIYPDRLSLPLKPEIAGWGTVPWGGARSNVTVRFETRPLPGKTWRLWLESRDLPGGKPPRVSAGAIRWEGRPPFVSGAAKAQDRVLVGQGPIDGRPVQGNLIFWAQGEPLAAGQFAMQFELVLETLP